MQIPPRTTWLNVLDRLLPPRPVAPAAPASRWTATTQPTPTPGDDRPRFRLPDLGTLRQMASGPPLARGSVLNILV